MFKALYFGAADKSKMASKMVVFKNYEESLFLRYLLLYLGTSDLPMLSMFQTNKASGQIAILMLYEKKTEIN